MPNRLDPAILDAYHTGQRVQVLDSSTGNVRSGMVSRSAGSRPEFILLHGGGFGSPEVLGPEDRVVAVQGSGDWVAVVDGEAS
jgi:hypothetical protein